MSTFKLATLAVVVLGLCSFVSASDIDELRHQAERLHTEAREHAERGHHDEAAALERRGDELMKKAEQLVRDGKPEPLSKESRKLKITHLNNLLQSTLEKQKLMKESGKNSERFDEMFRVTIAEMKLALQELKAEEEPAEHKLRREISGRQPVRISEVRRPELHRPELRRFEVHRPEVHRPEPIHEGVQLHRPEDAHHGDRDAHMADGPHREIAERLEHMHQAIQHLQHAGLHDIANHVAERVHATEAELHEHESHRRNEHMEDLARQMDEIRHEIGRLHERISELDKNR
ncbi:MAG: hypothetical protein WAO83_09720 [Fuerstiella sp.]